MKRSIIIHIRNGTVMVMLMCLSACGNAETQAKEAEAQASMRADSIAIVNEQQEIKAMDNEAEQLDADMDALEKELHELEDGI